MVARRTILVLTATSIAWVGCGPTDGPPTGGGDASASLASRAASEPLPQRFGVGRVATDEEIARLDIDVMPDGTGLPPGSGVATDGARIYANMCVACHGADLQGLPSVGDRLVPPDDQRSFPDGEVPFSTHAIGNYWPYATTVFDYVRRAMPYDRPGSMADDDVYAVTAFLLWRNGLIGESEVIDASSLPRVVMPARDRFVVDDRLAFDRVR